MGRIAKSSKMWVSGIHDAGPVLTRRQLAKTKKSVMSRGGRSIEMDLFGVGLKNRKALKRENARVRSLRCTRLLFDTPPFNRRFREIDKEILGLYEKFLEAKRKGQMSQYKVALPDGRVVRRDVLAWNEFSLYCTQNSSLGTGRYILASRELVLKRHHLLPKKFGLTVEEDKARGKLQKKRVEKKAKRRSSNAVGSPLTSEQELAAQKSRFRALNNRALAEEYARRERMLQGAAGVEERQRLAEEQKELRIVFLYQNRESRKKGNEKYFRDWVARVDVVIIR